MHCLMKNRATSRAVPSPPESETRPTASRPPSGAKRPSGWRERKREILTKHTPSTAESIAHGIVLKNDSLFVVTEHDGMIPLAGGHGFGVYHEDCRFLDGYVIELGGLSPQTLATNPRSGQHAIFELTNPTIPMSDGRALEEREIGMKIRRAVDGQALVMEDELTITSFAREPVTFEVKLRFRARFEDVFQVRGLVADLRGDLLEPRWEGGALLLSYHGRDGIERSVTLRFSQMPDGTEGTSAHFDISLPPGGQATLVVAITLSTATKGPRAACTKLDIPRLEERIADEQRAFFHECATLVTGSRAIDEVIERSFSDLFLLRTPLDGDSYFAGGVPWFATLFGRDSLITALFMLPYHPGIAEDTLRLLARHQGREVDTFRDEEPGKILHELRRGELARTGEIPDTPYYGSVDATPLFLILLARHAMQTGRLDLFHELRPNVDAALGWIANSLEHSAVDGFVSYDSDTDDELINQGWKDSGDAIVDEGGRIMKPPIALVEVQGYTYLAKNEIARILERAGDFALAERLREEAASLADRFNRDFWLAERDTYAMALGAGGLPAAVRSSNAGHALWTGIADDEKARTVSRILMSEGMFSGFGVRTLSAHEIGYNPISYHRGTVWPHDNAIIAAGLRAYGLDRAAIRVADGILRAAMSFPLRRLPELFCGFSRRDYGVPVRYPVACHPQAWAAGSIPALFSSLLGLEADGFSRRLHVRRPVLPSLVGKVDLHGLRVGGGRVDLTFRRASRGAVELSVQKSEGGVEVVLDEG